MEDLKGKMKAVSRRISHLRGRIETNSHSAKSSSYDRAEVTALTDLLRVATVYNDARGQNGSHIENTLCMVMDVIDETLVTSKGALDSDTESRLKSAWGKASDAVKTIRKMAEDVEKDP